MESDKTHVVVVRVFYPKKKPTRLNPFTNVIGPMTQPEAVQYRKKLLNDAEYDWLVAFRGAEVDVRTRRLQAPWPR